jgi:hypothetical protein
MSDRHKKLIKNSNDQINDNTYNEAYNLINEARILINQASEYGINNSNLSELTNSLNRDLNGGAAFGPNALEQRINQLKRAINNLKRAIQVRQNAEHDDQMRYNLEAQARNVPQSNLRQIQSSLIKRKRCNGKECQSHHLQKNFTQEQRERAAIEARILKQARQKFTQEQRETKIRRITPGPLRNSQAPEQFVKNLSKNEEVNSFKKLISGYDNLRSKLYKHNEQNNTTLERNEITVTNTHLKSFVNGKVKHGIEFKPYPCEILNCKNNSKKEKCNCCYICGYKLDLNNTNKNDELYPECEHILPFFEGASFLGHVSEEYAYAHKWCHNKKTQFEGQDDIWGIIERPYINIDGTFVPWRLDEDKARKLQSITQNFIKNKYPSLEKCKDTFNFINTLKAVIAKLMEGEHGDFINQFLNKPLPNNDIKKILNKYISGLYKLMLIKSFNGNEDNNEVFSLEIACELIGDTPQKDGVQVIQEAEE